MLEQYKNKENVMFLEVGSFEGYSANYFIDNFLTEIKWKDANTLINKKGSDTYLNFVINVDNTITKFKKF